MPNFKCQNKECELFDKDNYQPTVRFKWNPENQRFESNYSFCPSCKSFIDPEKEYEGFTNAWFKGENDRNYDNKRVKKYDFDRDAANLSNAKIAKKKR